MRTITRWFLVVVLGFTAGTKLFAPQVVSTAWIESGLIPSALAYPLAIAVPLLELAAAGMLLWSRTIVPGAVLCLFLSMYAKPRAKLRPTFFGREIFVDSDVERRQNSRKECAEFCRHGSTRWDTKWSTLCQ